MKVTDRLKQVVFKQLYKELGNAEIIPYKDSIWFINREEKYWYFEFETNGTLYWRYSFFPNFFEIFSLLRDDFEPILSEWVEEVLNHKVDTTYTDNGRNIIMVEEVLNHRVNTAIGIGTLQVLQVEEVLNHRVNTAGIHEPNILVQVEEVLNNKVNTTFVSMTTHVPQIEEVLNHKVSSTVFFTLEPDMPVEEVLNHKVNKSSSLSYQPDLIINGVLNSESVDSNRDWKVGNVLNENPTE